VQESIECSSLSRSDVKRRMQQKKDEGEDRGHVGSFDNTARMVRVRGSPMLLLD
jgi:hypothetical protein